MAGFIEQFITAAGVEKEKARFFFAMSNCNLDLALINVFEINEHSDTEVVARPRDPMAPRGTDRSARYVPLPSGLAAQGRKGEAKPASSSKIASPGTSRKDETLDESSQEEERQEYYARGSEKTGQQILGPPGRKTNPDKLISGLFTAAKEHEPEEVEPEDGGGAMSAAGPRVVPFQVRTYRLGDPSPQSEVIEGPQVHQKQKVDVALKCWRNWFSLNDGPLREFGDPQNVEFVDAIRRNEVPMELIEQARGGEVNLSLENHQNENYVLPKKVIRSFAGVGHRLGRPLDDDDDEIGSDDDTGLKKTEPSSWQVHDDSTVDSVVMSKDSQRQDRERDRTDEGRLSSRLRHELSEVKRAKLREIEEKEKEMEGEYKKHQEDRGRAGHEASRPLMLCTFLLSIAVMLPPALSDSHYGNLAMIEIIPRPDMAIPSVESRNDNILYGGYAKAGSIESATGALKNFPTCTEAVEGFQKGKFENWIGVMKYDPPEFSTAAELGCPFVLDQVKKALLLGASAIIVLTMNTSVQEQLDVSLLLEKPLVIVSDSGNISGILGVIERYAVVSVTRDPILHYMTVYHEKEGYQTLFWNCLLSALAVLVVFLLVKCGNLLYRRNNDIENKYTGFKLSSLKMTRYRTNQDSAITCAVCQDLFYDRQKLRILPCTHIFHIKCIDHNLLRRPFCPLCGEKVF